MDVARRVEPLPQEVTNMLHYWELMFVNPGSRADTAWVCYPALVMIFQHGNRRGHFFLISRNQQHPTLSFLIHLFLFLLSATRRKYTPLIDHQRHSFVYDFSVSLAPVVNALNSARNETDRFCQF
jgi:hypothetical protein